MTWQLAETKTDCRAEIIQYFCNNVSFSICVSNFSCELSMRSLVGAQFCAPHFPCFMLLSLFHFNTYCNDDASYVVMALTSKFHRILSVGYVCEHIYVFANYSHSIRCVTPSTSHVFSSICIIHSDSP